MNGINRPLKVLRNFNVWLKAGIVARRNGEFERITFGLAGNLTRKRFNKVRITNKLRQEPSVSFHQEHHRQDKKRLSN